MRSNNGTKTKSITLIIPESVDVLDITYYWKSSNGDLLKTTTAIMDNRLKDGAEISCYRFPEEET